MLQRTWLWWSLSLREPDMLSVELSSLKDMLGLVTQFTVKSSPAATVQSAVSRQPWQGQSLKDMLGWSRSSQWSRLLVSMQ